LINVFSVSRPLFSDIEGRELRRKMCMEATVINLDSQGRLVIPDKMMEYAEIKETLVVIGAGDHFEIWDSRVWKDYSKTIEPKNK
jgi:MraZ protein